jgi:hypothetical protein
MIGSSRETLTRLLSDLKRRELIRLEGSTLVIANRIALQAIASSVFLPRGGLAYFRTARFFSLGFLFRD